MKYVVNTHTHLDHAFGNCVFARLGATVISHAADRALLAKVGNETLRNIGMFGLKPEDMAGTEIVLPALTFSDRLQIDLGGELVEFIRTAPSHTEGSVVVLVPAKKLLFSGDILFTDLHPFMADGDLSGWPKTLDAMMIMDVERIIPGHGSISTKKDLAEMKAYLLQFDTTARKLAAEGKDADAITAELLKSLPKRPMADWMIAFNVKKRYAANLIAGNGGTMMIEAGTSTSCKSEQCGTVRAVITDAAEILALQKLAYQSEAMIYNDWSIPPLTETLEAVKEAFAEHTFLKICDAGRIIGSVRVSTHDGTCEIGRLIVHPDYQGKGIGTLLMQAVEAEFSAAKRFELFTGSRSIRNIRLYERLGYAIFRVEQLSDQVELVFMEKCR